MLQPAFYKIFLNGEIIGKYYKNVTEYLQMRKNNVEYKSTIKEIQCIMFWRIYEETISRIIDDLYDCSDVDTCQSR